MAKETQQRQAAHVKRSAIYQLAKKLAAGSNT
jgi:hypothetical protein